MNSPNYSSGLNVCPQDFSAHQLGVSACTFCGWQFTNADIRLPAAMKICPACNVYAGYPAVKCMYCGSPFYAGLDSAGNVASSQGYAQYPRQNQGFGMALPLDIKSKFNWGAFFFSWIWGLNHRKPETLLVIVAGIIPFGALVGSIYIGIKGNEWAWTSGRFQSLDDMLACQQIWAKWALWCFILSILVPCLIFMLLGMLGPLVGGAR